METLIMRKQHFENVNTVIQMNANAYIFEKLLLKLRNLLSNV